MKLNSVWKFNNSFCLQVWIPTQNFLGAGEDNSFRRIRGRAGQTRGHWCSRRGDRHRTVGPLGAVRPVGPVGPVRHVQGPHLRGIRYRFSIHSGNNRIIQLKFAFVMTFSPAYLFRNVLTLSYSSYENLVGPIDFHAICSRNTGTFCYRKANTRTATSQSRWRWTRRTRGRRSQTWWRRWWRRTGGTRSTPATSRTQ